MVRATRLSVEGRRGVVLVTSALQPQKLRRRKGERYRENCKEKLRFEFAAQSLTRQGQGERKAGFAIPVLGGQGREGLAKLCHMVAHAGNASVRTACWGKETKLSVVRGQGASHFPHTFNPF